MDPATQLEEYLSSTDVPGLRRLLRFMGDSGGGEDRVLQLVSDLCRTHPIRLA